MVRRWLCSLCCSGLRRRRFVQLALVKVRTIPRMSLTLETDWLIRVCLSRLVLCRASLVPVLVPVNLVGDFSLEPWNSAVAAFMARHGGPCDYREIRSEGLLVQEGFGCCDAGRTACCDEVGLARCSRICPPCSPSSLSLLHRLAACRAATFWILRDTCSTVSSDAGFDIRSVTFWIFRDTSTVSGDAGFDIFRHHSGKGTNKR